jgi:pSer/pThr/pTyr-binding forkhead associated (FHA) protein
MLEYTLSVWIPDVPSVAIYKLSDNYLIGRHTSCDIVIPNRFVSGTHCTLILMPPNEEHHYSYYLIKDGNVFANTSSTNGTWVNGMRIANESKEGLCVTNVELRHQDIITFGGNKSPKATFEIKGLEGDETGTFSAEIDI